MTARRFALSLTVSVVAVLLPTAAAQAAACDTWYGPGGNSTEAKSGEWGDAAAWSAGVPTAQTPVCVTIPGTYTVTLIPYADEHYPATDDGGVAETLTIGASSGSQKLEVLGEAHGATGNWINLATLQVSDGVTVGKNGILDLEATERDAPNQENNPGGSAGGTALLETDTSNQPGHPFIVEGAFIAGTSSSKYEPEVHSHAWTSSGSLQVTSGKLEFYNEEPATSTGSISVSSGATLFLERGSTFDNDGPISNAGATILNASPYQGKWIQGPNGLVAGNTVIIEGDGGLEETASSAPSPFEIATSGAAYLLGTIPKGQTITIVDVNNSQTATVYLGYATPLINEGTIHMDVPAGSTESSTELTEGSIVNKGTIYGTVEGAKARNIIDSVITNEPGGVIDAASGTLFDNREIINNGSVQITAGSLLEMVATKFVNEAGGTISPQIASASSFGELRLFSGSSLQAAGTLAPTLAGGFTPTSGEEFDIITEGAVSGTFATVSGGFTADYTHETASPGYVGVVYGAAVPISSPGPTPTPTPTPIITAVTPKVTASATSSDGRVKVKLTCPKGGSCGKVTVKVTVTEHLKGGRVTAVSAKAKSKSKSKAKSKSNTKVIVIATKSVSVAAGKSVTLDLSLNATGAKLLKKYRKLQALVTVSAAGKTIRTQKVTITPAKAKVKHK